MSKISNTTDYNTFEKECSELFDPFSCESLDECLSMPDVLHGRWRRCESSLKIHPLIGVNLHQQLTKDSRRLDLNRHTLPWV
jgi:hypothetical protein